MRELLQPPGRPRQRLTLLRHTTSGMGASVRLAPFGAASDREWPVSDTPSHPPRTPRSMGNMPTRRPWSAPPRPNKYDRLQALLAHSGASAITLSFAALDTLVGGLPRADCRGPHAGSPHGGGTRRAGRRARATCAPGARRAMSSRGWTGARGGRSSAARDSGTRMLRSAHASVAAHVKMRGALPTIPPVKRHLTRDHHPDRLLLAS